MCPLCEFSICKSQDDLRRHFARQHPDDEVKVEYQQDFYVEKLQKRDKTEGRRFLCIFCFENNSMYTLSAIAVSTKGFTSNLPCTP